MKKLLLAIALLFTPTGAWAQCNGLFPNNYVCGNTSGTAASPTPISAAAFGLGLNVGHTPVANSTSGDFFYNNNGVLGEVAPTRTIDYLQLTCDGSTDTSAAINAAIAAAAAYTTIYLPPGNCYQHISITFAALQSGIRLTGAGPGPTLLTTDQDVPNIVVGSYTYAGTNNWVYGTYALYFDQIDNIELANTGATKTNAVGVQVRGLQDGSIHDILCSGTTDCIVVNPVSNWNQIYNIRQLGGNNAVRVQGDGYTADYNSTGNIYHDIMGESVAEGIVTFTGCTWGDATVSDVNGVGVASGGQGVAGGAVAAVYLNGGATCADNSRYAANAAISNIKMDGVSDYVIHGTSTWSINFGSFAGGGDVTTPVEFDSASANGFSWTPADASGAGLTLTYYVNYTYSNNLIHFYGSIAFPSNSNGATAAIGGLPITVPNMQYAILPCAIPYTPGSSTPLFILTTANTKTFGVVTSGLTPVTNATLSGVTFRFNCSYPMS